MILSAPRNKNTHTHRMSLTEVPAVIIILVKVVLLNWKTTQVKVLHLTKT